MEKEKFINDLLTWAGYMSRRFKNTKVDDFGEQLEKEIKKFSEAYILNQPYL